MNENVTNYCSEFKYKLIVQSKPPVLNLQLFTNLVLAFADMVQSAPLFVTNVQTLVHILRPNF